MGLRSTAREADRRQRRGEEETRGQRETEKKRWKETERERDSETERERPRMERETWRERLDRERGGARPPTPRPLRRGESHPPRDLHTQ